jgi:hypothetical protein
MANNSKSDLALAMLVRLIDEGIEYPEAEWRVIKNYGLSNAETEALSEEYMDYCARGCVL